MPTALCLTGRLLGEGGRGEAAREACTTAVGCAIDQENLVLAVVAAREAERFGGTIGPLFDQIARAFCKGSAQHGKGAHPPIPLPPAASFNPLPSALSGVLLNNKALELIHNSTRRFSERARPPISAVPLFSNLDEEGLRILIEALRPHWVAAGHTIIEQGTPGREAYWVARGELEARRELPNGQTISLAMLTSGSLFGEMALLSKAPRASAVVAQRPSIVAAIDKADLDKAAQRQPAIAIELGEHCRDRMVQNLLRTSEVLRVVPQSDLPALVAKFKIACFEKQERLVVQDEFPTGLFIIASGEVAVVRREPEGDPLVLKSLGFGEVVGEVAAILRRKTSADVLAVHPTVTLFLPTNELLGLVREHPVILAQLYLLAVHRDEETRAILDEDVSEAGDVDLV
ncbi:MAG: cyclic nucleotide-binding domain-containing protein [Polyangiaceae bacterium]